MTQKAFAIAIDGPVASGKGTIADALAQKLHGFHLNTGAMYRCLGLYCLEHKISLHDSPTIVKALSEISITFKGEETFLNGENVSQKIKQPEVAEAASAVAVNAEVRREMVKRQRAIGLEVIAKGQIILVDARDAATKIFPDAPFKIFLTANPETRAQRRLEQLGEGNYQQMLEEIKKRDFQDMHREATPLVSDPENHGYFVIDDSNLTESDTIAMILKKIEEKQ